MKFLFNAWWEVRQEIIHPPQAEHNSYWADLSATSDLHNPNKFPKLLLFIATSTLFFSLLFNVPFAVSAAVLISLAWFVLMHVFTRVTVLMYFALKCKKKVFKTVFISLFISHLFVYCVLFGIYCFALHPEHLGQHAGILGHKFSFPCPESCTFPLKMSTIALPHLAWDAC